MAFSTDGRIALSAAGSLSTSTGLARRNGTAIATSFGNAEMMGKKLEYKKHVCIGRADKPNKTRGRVFMSLTADVAGEMKLRDLDMEKRDPKTVAAVILGGGAGTRLFPLTKRRAKPAVPIGGAYRLIDVPMSNCINSGISKVYILTQFNSASLNRHISRAYSIGNGVNFGDGFVERKLPRSNPFMYQVLAATQTPGEMGKKWFQGTADAVRQFHWLFEMV
ncbi:Clathrin assembly protein complex 2 beta large chain [Asimina triloba]